MMEKINSQGNIQSMLQTLRSYQSQAAGGMDDEGNKVGNLNGLNGSKGTEGPSGFGDLVRQTVNKVNENQTNASKLASAYERGEGVPLTDVVLSMQKSSLSFEATLQVRNKVLKAYEDILNMPV
ncbi:flagellar hook-basal body complex protein FliE [Limnohabitans sp. MMS-10A-178]|jgi:flagellar hook-basal body complex protein FliE|uniref:flagellar hook-basal body complex protein FliE n=1 Tax=Limnohabitans sp. MMS-10A-178 TaxID=1835767 RepID=UPI000D397E7F|nr:flagellar hook-basal body complex protein FliE [Limnohabitans sp. MMS-10A-178]PUE16508.1 flagellar hook-basal body complex protein FliE [Limnohabitans sp. MMS-10A-178]